MESNKKQPALLYLDKNGFYFYVTGLPSVISLAFLATSVKDMDVINGASIMNQIKTFIEQYKILPCTITFIISPNITFDKDFIDLTTEEYEDKSKIYIDTIPFENVMSKAYPIEKGFKVIGWNEELYLELKISFEKCGFIVDQVIPYHLLGADQPLIQNLTQDNAAQLLRKIDHLKQFTMLRVQKDKQQVVQNQDGKKESKSKKNYTRLIAMGIIFVILFAILAFMLLKK